MTVDGYSRQRLSELVLGGVIRHMLENSPHTAADGALTEGASMKQTAIPCMLMRGGTSKGPFFPCLSMEDHAAEPRFHYAGVVRTARRLFEGRVLNPGTVWDGHV